MMTADWSEAAAVRQPPGLLLLLLL